MRRFSPLLVAALLLLPIGTADAVEVQSSYDAESGVLHLKVPGIYWQFRVDRADAEEGPFDYLGFEHLGCTKGCEWFDQELEPGETYYYLFDLLAQDGTPIEAGPIAVTIPKTGEGPLDCVSGPNPFVDATTLRFRIPDRLAAEAGVPAAVAIHDATGRRVRTLHEGELGRGVHTIEWDGRDGEGQEMRSGVYFYTIRAAGTTTNGRLLKIR
ncbi:MAG: T9SS type A sorting domain-containing protein [Candidatus Eisenbacteria bacterium]|nr:T9SS type A sorting domain-containing protein [Candidatus Latescibacterota bacterium]MBD3301357.1 T9SS type A sorting domain-containing protein [Candidatus Eisenbacteria bacterium]